MTIFQQERTPWSEWGEVDKNHLKEALLATKKPGDAVREREVLTIVHLAPKELVLPWLRGRPDRILPFLQRCVSHLNNYPSSHLLSLPHLHELADTHYTEFVTACTNLEDYYNHLAAQLTKIGKEQGIERPLAPTQPTELKFLTELAKNAATRKLNTMRQATKKTYS